MIINEIKPSQRMINDNMKSFGKYEPLVRAWCKRHQMFWVMPEFKELFEQIDKLKEVSQ